MAVTAVLQEFRFHNEACCIYVPVDSNTPGINSPYWQKVWPAAIGLCRFLEREPHWVEQQHVLELAAGLGLPGLFAARLAKEVLISDIEPDAVTLMERSIVYSKLKTVSATIRDWSSYSKHPIPGVLLLSDVNYAPGNFAALKELVDYYLDHGTTIILSTPQRLLAKPFVMMLLPDVIRQAEEEVLTGADRTVISVLVLKREQQ